MTIYCTYLSTHPSGWFYGGKGQIKAINAGKYKGSGVLLSNLFKKYPMSEWSCEILDIFEDEKDAYYAESLLVTKEFVSSDYCANLCTGGKYFIHSVNSKAAISKSLRLTRALEDKEVINKLYTEVQNRPEVKAAKSAAIKSALKSSEKRAEMSRVAKIALSKPEIRQKIIISSTNMWADEKMRNLINTNRSAACGDEWKAKLSQSANFRKSFSVEVNGVVYARQVDACRELNMNRKQLRKLPSFKELT